MKCFNNEEPNFFYKCIVGMFNIQKIIRDFFHSALLRKKVDMEGIFNILWGIEN